MVRGRRGYVEVDDGTGGTFVNAGLRWCVAVSMGGGIWFGCAALIGVFFEQVDVGYAWGRDIGEGVRALVGSAMLALLVATVLMVILTAADRALMLPKVEYLLRQSPASVPAAADRARLLTPPAAIIGGLVAALGIGGFAYGAILIGMTASGDVEETGIPIVVSMVLGVGWLLVRKPLRRRAEIWRSRAHVVWRHWNSARDRASRAEDRRHEAGREDAVPRALERTFGRRISRAAFGASVVLGVGILLWFVPVVVRQPCRTCEPRSLSPGMNEGMNLATMGTTALVMTPAIVLGALVLAGIVRELLRERAVVRWVSDGMPRRADPYLFSDLLTGPRAGERMARVLAVCGVLALGLVFSFTWFDLEWVPLALSGTAAAALLLGSYGVLVVERRTTHRLRVVIRTVFSPGDVGYGYSEMEAEKEVLKAGSGARRST